MVTWDLPEYPNGPLTGYMIYYKRSNVTTSPPGSDRTGYESVMVSGTQSEYNITMLTPFTNYSIFIEALGTNNFIGYVDTEILELTKSGRAVDLYWHQPVIAVACKVCVCMHVCKKCNQWSC